MVALPDPFLQGGHATLGVDQFDLVDGLHRFVADGYDTDFRGVHWIGVAKLDPVEADVLAVVVPVVAIGRSRGLPRRIAAL